MRAAGVSSLAAATIAVPHFAEEKAEMLKRLGVEIEMSEMRVVFFRIPFIGQGHHDGSVWTFDSWRTLRRIGARQADRAARLKAELAIEAAAAGVGRAA